MMKFEKQFIAGATVAMTILNGATANAQIAARCQETYDAWVTASSMYIKAEANAKAEKIGSLFKGDHVTIIGEDGNYAKIAFGPRLTKIGYVLKQYLTDKPLNNNDKSIKKIMDVNTDALNMRRIASTSGSKLGKLYKGFSVEIDDSIKEINRDGFTWVKCKALIKPNGDVVKREFYVAKKYLKEQSVSVSTPAAKPEVSAPVVKPETKPEVSTPVVKPETKPEVEAPVAKPEAKPEVEAPVETPEVELAPVVTEESIEIVEDGDVVDAYGNVLLTLKKGDKVTLVGEDHGVDKTKIDLNNGSYGIIHKCMVEKDFHSHDEFVFGRPCNPSNLGQSMDLVEEYETTRDLVVFNSDCKYFSTSIVVPKGAKLDIAKDFYNPETDNVEVHYKFIDVNQNVIEGQGFVPAYQFR